VVGAVHSRTYSAISRPAALRRRIDAIEPQVTATPARTRQPSRTPWMSVAPVYSSPHGIVCLNDKLESSPQGYDVVSVVAHPALAGLPDDQILAYAAADGRALVTANIKDFIPLDSRYRGAGQAHPGSWCPPRPSLRTAASPPRSQLPLNPCSAARTRCSSAKCSSLPEIRPNRLPLMADQAWAGIIYYLQPA
jgi:hypothetical protein